MVNSEAERVPRDYNFKSIEGWVQPFTFWKRQTAFQQVCVCVALICAFIKT